MVSLESRRRGEGFGVGLSRAVEAKESARPSAQPPLACMPTGGGRVFGEAAAHVTAAVRGRGARRGAAEESAYRWRAKAGKRRAGRRGLGGERA